MIPSALEGIRVLDCTGLLPGPYCTMMMAELGAEVIKVESVGSGDPVRSMFPRSYRYLNGNKKLITLDVRMEEGKELLLKLSEASDVFVEGFRPGVAKRLGIDFDAMKKVNAAIIYCSISGYGQTGPYRDRPGHDVNYQGVTGLLSISGDPDSGPELCAGIQIADIAGSMFALTSILAGLMRPKGSPALFLDISMTEATAMWMMPRYMEYLDRARPPKSQLMGRGPYGVFKTRDKKYLTLGVLEDHFWERLCRVLGFDDWASDDSLKGWVARNENRHKIIHKLKAVIMEKDLEHWLQEFTRADIPVGPVRDLDNWQDDPQFKYRNFMPDHENSPLGQDNFRRFPIDCLMTEKSKTKKAPVLGRDTEDVLRGTGLSAGEISRLRDKRVI